MTIVMVVRLSTPAHRRGLQIGPAIRAAIARLGCDYVLVGGRQLPPSVRQAGTAGVRVHRPWRGRAAVGQPTATEYIDAMASLWYCNIGHGRREIADAVAAQIRTLEAYSCFEPFTNAPADELAERLADFARSRDAGVPLRLGVGGGRHGDEARPAHPRARRQPERTVIISRARGYHGTNLGGTSAQGIAPNREGWGPLVPDVVQVPSDDIEALSVLMAERGGEVAAVLTEPVQGAGGVFPPRDGYLAELRRLCDQHGALLVFDEVITGFGRLGTWFAAEHYGVVPDMTTFAKAVTSGYQPVGGVIVGAPSASRSSPTPRSSSATATRTRATPRRAPPVCATSTSSTTRACSAEAEPDRQAPRRRTAGARRRRCDRPRRGDGSGVGGRPATRPGRRGDPRPDARRSA